MAYHSFTLLLAGLNTIPEEEWPPMPALQTLLSKGRREAINSGTSEILLEHFGIKGKAGAALPVGPLSALGDGVDTSNGWWLCADPVHLVADRDQLYLSASEELGLEQDDADALVAELNRLYAEDGWLFVAPTPQRWYLRLPHSLSMDTIPTSEAMGRRVGEVLPGGDDAMNWQRVMTEIQMLLHTHPVNAQRSVQGLMTVNGLWFWGGGNCPHKTSNPAWDCVVADGPLARGLAVLNGIACEYPSVITPQKAVAAGERVLWQESITSPGLSEEDIFAPLLTQLQVGELDELVVELAGHSCWYIGRADLRRWWRRRKPLTSLLGGVG